MNTEEARELLEGGPGRPAGHVADIPEGQGPYAFGGQWSGMAKLLEELGELQAVIGKIMGVGGTTDHWQGDLRPKLVDEMADVTAAITHLVTYALAVEEEQVYMDRSQLKCALFVKWHLEGQRNNRA